MASLMFQLASSCKGRIERHRTVGDKNAPKRMHIYFSLDSRQRFVMTEEKTKQGREFTELREEQLGKSLCAIEGECMQELGLE
ncbi:hypothetical protein R7D97_16385 [Vibrio sp. Vb5031]|uniref:Uncharacterized protein n=2 Tax=Vibrio TaxID=662 RepID=A0A0M0HY16_9VIBR|nr:MULTISPECIES: hypothetical protein [Vibrio]KOO06955.1 hypothetical protein AKJ31_14760 [Vibrio hepatarius]MCA2421860.1 hypothetical protein [Vibrio alginolyticus]MCA2446532.1 hypothetical protein [Vibrio alginolyticus]MCR9821578.1 hypothetical protein [Vibrio parahaemolyticus]MDF5108339.1 hypothetical protein [Vibrio parahaemolyticus]